MLTHCLTLATTPPCEGMRLRVSASWKCPTLDASHLYYFVESPTLGVYNRITNVSVLFKTSPPLRPDAHLSHSGSA